MSAPSLREIKLVRSLRERKYRDETGLFCVEGEKLVAEALRSGFDVVKVWRRDEIGEAAMARISLLSSPSPVLALVRKPSVHAAPETGPGLYLALDSIRDPGNLGTILRIDDWFGLKAVLASPDTVDAFNPKTVQATMGAIFRVPLYYTDIPAVCREAASRGGSVHGTFLDGENIYTQALDCGAQAPAIIVVGSEADGISPEVAATVTSRLYIPSFPEDDRGSESLNAAVAAAVTVAEFRRRQVVAL